MPQRLLQAGAPARHPLDGTVAGLSLVVASLPLLGALINGAVAIMPVDGPGIVRLGGGAGGHGARLCVGGRHVRIDDPRRRVDRSLHPQLRTVDPGRSAGHRVGLQIDQLSMVMALVITGVGTLIHFFSLAYMQDDPGYARYFAYLNLFVACMLTLVLGASYPVMFVGWEGVGLCSYLLIGFWFSDRANVAAGTKAFVVNRIGDFGFLVAMFLMWNTVQRLDFVGAHAALSLMGGSPAVLAIALFLFLGCVGKSAQLPLYVWLPDAMAGPTPVSALIHAATMVTAVCIWWRARARYLRARRRRPCWSQPSVG
ncbi:MAG: hypothetical protein IPP90_17255 [Gemmatimonadaceae bacterium]|nr:hypothetical protein [Gemmatimonadaceae bacterium]